MKPPSVTGTEKRTGGEPLPLRLVTAAEPQSRAEERLPLRRPFASGIILILASLGLAAAVAAAIAAAIAAAGTAGGAGAETGAHAGQSERAREALRFGRHILTGLRSGPSYSWLVWTALGASGLLLVLGRRAERPDSLDAAHERFGQAGRRRREEDPPGIFRLRSSEAGTRDWRDPRSIGAVGWSAALIFLSVAILVVTFPWHESPARWVLWSYAAAGTALGVRLWMPRAILKARGKRSPSLKRM